MLTIGNVEALNDFRARCHPVYLDGSNRIKNATIWGIGGTAYDQVKNVQFFSYFASLYTVLTYAGDS